MRNIVMIGVLATVLALGACKPKGDFERHTGNAEFERTSNTEAPIPPDFKIANPCPVGVPTVYQRPDGAYVVKNSENNNNWTEITMTPAEFCQEYTAK